jgi:hypothetical protein
VVVAAGAQPPISVALLVDTAQGSCADHYGTPEDHVRDLASPSAFRSN